LRCPNTEQVVESLLQMIDETGARRLLIETFTSKERQLVVDEVLPVLRERKKSAQARAAVGSASLRPRRNTPRTTLRRRAAGPVIPTRAIRPSAGLTVDAGRQRRDGGSGLGEVPVRSRRDVVLHSNRPWFHAPICWTVTLIRSSK
jgi:hypothetical protein